ncbi:hypothetical protein Bhz59_00070 [Stenotrophomonas phage vB_SmaS_Bhz59]
MYTPNPNVDHLDPANWWPHYDMASDRRAIPAHCLLVLDADLNAYAHPINVEPGVGDLGDNWRHLSGVDKDLRTHEVILEWGSTGELKVAPDAAVFIAQRDFERLLPELPAALTATFDTLWAHHQAGRISRSAFDARAADLRGMRDHITKVLELRS